VRFSGFFSVAKRLPEKKKRSSFYRCDEFCNRRQMRSGGVCEWRTFALSGHLPRRYMMSNFIHQRVIEKKTNKQKTIYNKHRNTIDVQDYQAFTCV